MKKIITAVLAAALLICIVCGATADAFTHTYSTSVPVRYLDGDKPYTQNKTVTVATGRAKYTVNWTEVTINGKKYLKPTGGSSQGTSMSLGALGDSKKSYCCTTATFTFEVQSGDKMKASVTSFFLCGSRHTEGTCANGKYSYYGSTTFSTYTKAQSKTYSKKLK